MNRAEVAVFGFTLRPQTYSYLAQPGMLLKPGQLVTVPFGKSTRQGIVSNLSKGSESAFELKEIAAAGPVLLSPNQLRLSLEIAETYFISLAEALGLMLPRLPKAGLKNSPKKPLRQQLFLFPSYRQASGARPNLGGQVFSHGLATKLFDSSWQDISSGRVNTVLGTRSALFAPFQNLSKITIFQTESDLYKEERRPYYRALSLAQSLAKISRAEIEAVSFSPRVQDHYLLPHQIKTLVELPQTTVINLRSEPLINRRLVDQLERDKSKRVLVFLNRKSEKGALVCRTCKARSFTEDPTTCPNCGSADVRFSLVNLGTLAKEIDRKVSGKRTYATQQIFFQDTIPFDTVVVLSADTYLSQSNFLSSEKTFQMLTNLLRLVKLGGQLWVQTAHPTIHAITSALKNDYPSFYESELKLRQDSGYPPFTNLAKLTYAAKTEEEEEEEEPRLELPDNIEVFGPFGTKFPYWIARGQDLSILAKLERPWKIDLDPLNL